MTIYSIVRVEDGYVVQADEQSILKVTSRRKAAQLITEASGLLIPNGAEIASPSDDLLDSENRAVGNVERP